MGSVNQTEMEVSELEEDEDSIGPAGEIALDIASSSGYFSDRDPVEILGKAELPDGGGSLVLVGSGGNHMNIWLDRSGSDEISDLDSRALRIFVLSQLSLFNSGYTLDYPGSSGLKYQTFGIWDGGYQEDIGSESSRLEVLKENGDLGIRITVDRYRYLLSVSRKLAQSPMGYFMHARINSMGCHHVPRLLGMSMWERKGRVMPWLKLTRETGSVQPSFRTFLKDLGDISKAFLELDGDKARRFLVQLSLSKDRTSFRRAVELGRMLGSLHSCLVMEDFHHSEGHKRVGTDIVELFSPSRMDIEDIGTAIGTSSYYLGELKREFVRLLGDKQVVNPKTGRRLKPLKRTVIPARVDGMDELSLDMFRTSFMKSEKQLRSRLGSIRSFRGAPILPVALDCRLEKIEHNSEGGYILNGFGWDFYGVEKEKLEKFLPLKDLSMLMNSFMKARYLTARQLFSNPDLPYESRQLQLLFLDYNLAKGGYAEMMEDFSVLRVMERRELPFKYIYKLSLVGSLWQERIRNSLVQGYTSELTGLGKEQLLSYPDKADTVKGIRAIQSMVALSDVLRTLERGRIPSSAGLESDLLCALAP
ncbi:MAG: hypothetical protein ACMUIE_00085 [Thermoplasmatota archaeon]